MEKWEYCSVVLIQARESFLSGNEFVARVAYYSPDGNIRVEELKTNLKVEALHHSNDAIGYALAYLGQQGWELVSVQRATNTAGFGYDCKAVLKRPVATT